MHVILGGQPPSASTCKDERRGAGPVLPTALRPPGIRRSTLHQLMHSHMTELVFACGRFVNKSQNDVVRALCLEEGLEKLYEKERPCLLNRNKGMPPSPRSFPQEKNVLLCCRGGRE